MTLPDYAERLLAFHEAHLAELRRVVRCLPIRSGCKVLDVACGDGTYSMLMARRGAAVTGFDLDPSFLTLAENRAAAEELSLAPEKGNAEAMPFADGTFDGAFCAQSFYSMPNVPRVLSEMRRVVRPGGWVGVLENDTVHQVVMPWPPELELALRLAEHRALAEKRGDEARYYIGRFLGAELERAGLRDAKVRCFATHRSAPLADNERTFLAGYLSELLERALPKLESSDRREALRIASPDSPDCMLDSEHFAVTYLDVLACARVPGEG